MTASTLAIGWQLTEIHGWGLVGVHLSLHEVAQGRPPLLLEQPKPALLREVNLRRLASLARGFEEVSALSANHPGRRLRLHGCTMLHALGNGFVPGPASDRFRGERNVGVIAFEDTRFSPALRGRLADYDGLVVHSSFNQALLRDQGFTEARCVFQGVDPLEMRDRPPTRRFGDRFVIFSGGKLEFRKGQDVVLAAFGRFHRAHPEALLVTAWHNLWPSTAADIVQSPLRPPAPGMTPRGTLAIGDWALACGAPPGSVVDLGLLGREEIAAVLPECHAAVFPNRCEGATNLVAMEAMACGVPVILSANTGHLDLIRDGNCLPLRDQKPVEDGGGGRAGWGEPSVEEVVKHLESLFAQRDRAEAIGASGRSFIQAERSWSVFGAAFVAAVT